MVIGDQLEIQVSNNFTCKPPTHIISTTLFGNFFTQDLSPPELL